MLARCPTGPLALPRVRDMKRNPLGRAGRGLRHNASPTPLRGLLKLLLHWGRGRFDGPHDAHPFEEISRPAASNQQPAACRLACLRLRRGATRSRHAYWPVPCSLLLVAPGLARGAACPCLGSLGCVARHQGLAPEPIMAQETILSGSLPCGVAADLSLVSFFILQCTCLVLLFDAR